MHLYDPHFDIHFCLCIFLTCLSLSPGCTEEIYGNRLFSLCQTLKNTGLTPTWAVMSEPPWPNRYPARWNDKVPKPIKQPGESLRLMEQLLEMMWIYQAEEDCPQLRRTHSWIPGKPPPDSFSLTEPQCSHDFLLSFILWVCLPRIQIGVL